MFFKKLFSIDIKKNVEQRDGYTQIKKKLLDEGKSFLTTNSDLIQILESQIQIPDNDWKKGPRRT